MSRPLIGLVGPLASANKLSDFPDFNDAAKLGTGKEMVDRLTNLVAIFENPALDFSKSYSRSGNWARVNRSLIERGAPG